MLSSSLVVSRIRFGAVNMSRQCLFDYRWLHQLSCLYTLKWLYEEDTIHPHTAVFSNPVTYIPACLLHFYTTYMLLHERKCNVIYVARGIDVDSNINDIVLLLM